MATTKRRFDVVFVLMSLLVACKRKLLKIIILKMKAILVVKAT